MNKVKISVIVPVYNAEEFLPNFFEKYLNQSVLNKDIELVIVDNGSSDSSKDIIEKNIKKNANLNIRYLYFDRVADSYASRNFGVKHSSGEFLVFTDSDCLPKESWLENILLSINEGIVVSGSVEIQILNQKNIWEIFDSIAHLNNNITAINGKVATANLAVTRSDFLKVGFFEERYSGGDHEWSQRAQRMGLQVIYHEKVKVLHPSRKYFKDILQKSKRIAYGKGTSHKTNNKSLFSLLVLFFFKIFNFKTNFRYSKLLHNKRVPINSIVKFNFYFTIIRFAQLNSAVNGYKNKNVRKLNIN